MQTHSVELGERIKRLRVAQNLTLKQLGEKARVSATHLSEIERGQSSPTVGALARIARALGEAPALLVSERPLPRVAVVARERRRTLHDEGARCHLLGGSLAGADMSVVEIELAPDAHFDPGAGGEEFLLVLAGSLELRVGEATRVLAEGDAIHYAAEHARTFRARGGACRALWVAVPPWS